MFHGTKGPYIMNFQIFFNTHRMPLKKQYEALRAFYMDKKSAVEVGQTFGYSKATVYSIARDFKKQKSMIKNKLAYSLFLTHFCVFGVFAVEEENKNHPTPNQSVLLSQIALAEELALRSSGCARKSYMRSNTDQCNS